MNLLTASSNVLKEQEGQELTEIQLAVVHALFEDSTQGAGELAKKVGCGRDYIYKVLSKQHVREYIISHAKADLLISSGEAVAVMRKLLTSKSDYIKLESAKDIQTRNDIGNVNQVQGVAVQVNIDLS